MLRLDNIREQLVAETCDVSPHDNGKKPHILVIDDEQDILRIVALCLEQSGYDVSTVNSTEEAYCLISNFEFDVILTDVMMPDEDGISFLARIHQILPDVPVIIMTGFAQLQMAVNAIKNGAFDFIHKPFDFEYLRQVMRKAVTFSSLRSMVHREGGRKPGYLSGAKCADSGMRKRQRNRYPPRYDRARL